MNSVAQALHGKLTGDTALMALVRGVYEDQAPQGSEYPFVVFTLVTAPDAYTFGARVWTDSLWQIRVFDESESAALAGSAMDRVDALLTDQPLTVAGTAAMVVRRLEHLPGLPEVDDSGIPIRSKGARFQIGVRA